MSTAKTRVISMNSNIGLIPHQNVWPAAQALSSSGGLWPCQWFLTSDNNKNIICWGHFLSSVLTLVIEIMQL